MNFDKLSTSRLKLVLVSTVPETISVILKGQPRWLSRYFDVVVVSSPGPHLKKIRESEGIEIIEVSMSRKISVFQDALSVFQMWLLLRKLRPNIVHSYTPKAGLVAMLASMLCKTPVRIHTFTGLIFPTSKGFKKIILKVVDRIICACATIVIPEGLGVSMDLRENKITKKPLRLIGNGNISGVDVAHFKPRQVRSFRESNAIVFCFVGRLNTDKGILELLDAFGALSGERLLLIAGEIDADNSIASQYIDRIKRDDRIKYLGYVDDVREVFEASDVMVLPSYREGFPNVLLQAGAMEVPSIATNVNGSNEVIVNCENGWLVEPMNSRALQSAMEVVMCTDRAQLKKMGEIARLRVIEKYEQSFYRSKLLEFYESALNEKVSL